MTLKIFYPQNFDNRISKYEVSEHNQIKSRYETIYKQNFTNDIKGIKARFQKDINDLKIHCELLSCCLSPFLRKEIDNYELLFIEPLLYLRNIGRIDSEIPIWDFVLGEIVEDEITRLIFGEVKGQKAGVKDNYEKLIQNYQEFEILKIISDYIVKDPNIHINIKKIKIEFILVIQNIYLENYIESLKTRGLKLNIWELRSDWEKTDFQIIIHRYDDFLNQASSSTEDNRTYRKMMNKVSSKKFPIIDDLIFTYASDLDRILDRFKKLYENKFGLEIVDKNFIALINDIGGGKFYDDENVVGDLLVKIKKRYNELNLIIRKNGKELFKERVNLKEKVINERLKNFIEKKRGEMYLNQVIEEIKPSKISTLSRWLK